MEMVCVSNGRRAVIISKRNISVSCRDYERYKTFNTVSGSCCSECVELDDCRIGQLAVSTAQLMEDVKTRIMYNLDDMLRQSPDALAGLIVSYIER